MKQLFKMMALAGLFVTLFACKPCCKSPCKVAEQTYGYMIDNPEKFVASLYEADKMSSTDKEELAQLIKEKGEEDLQGTTFKALDEIISEDKMTATVKLESTNIKGKKDIEEVTLKKDGTGNWHVVLDK